MTKAEIKQYLTQRGGESSARAGSVEVNGVWKQAFSLHQKETGIRLKSGCGSCVKKVWQWLNQ